MPRSSQPADKQLRHLKLADVLKKRDLDQGLKANEFARLVGISYSQARNWFRLPGFPLVGSVVFWSDFVIWRQAHCGLTALLEQVKSEAAKQSAAKQSFDEEMTRNVEILMAGGSIARRKHSRHAIDRE